MKRKAAWNGFYQSLRIWNTPNRYNSLTRQQQRALKMRLYRYAKSLVREHGWQDVHTTQFCTA